MKNLISYETVDIIFEMLALIVVGAAIILWTRQFRQPVVAAPECRCPCPAPQQPFTNGIPLPGGDWEVPN